MNEKQREDYTRVSHVLSPFSNLQHVDPDILANACLRGTKIHKICEGIINGLGEIGVDEESWGYVESFKQWWETGIEVFKVEERLWHDELELTGQIDIITKLADGFGIVDLKTSSRPSKTWAVQGSGYALLCEHVGYPVRNISFIQLNKHGKPPAIHQYPIDKEFFLSVFRTYKHFYA